MKTVRGVNRRRGKTTDNRPKKKKPEKYIPSVSVITFKDNKIAKKYVKIVIYKNIPKFSLFSPVCYVLNGSHSDGERFRVCEGVMHSAKQFNTYTSSCAVPEALVFWCHFHDIL